MPYIRNPYGPPTLKELMSAQKKLRKKEPVRENHTQPKNRIVPMFQVKIIDSYQLQTYERVVDSVNKFCASHDVVEVKSDVKKDDVIYSIVYRVSQKTDGDEVLPKQIPKCSCWRCQGLETDPYEED